MSTLNEVKSILADVLQLDVPAEQLNNDTQLLGGLPEFDSMAVVNVITALEENYDFMVDDDEISAETFETIDSLVNFVNEKI